MARPSLTEMRDYYAVPFQNSLLALDVPLQLMSSLQLVINFLSFQSFVIVLYPGSTVIVVLSGVQQLSGMNWM